MYEITHGIRKDTTSLLSCLAAGYPRSDYLIGALAGDGTAFTHVHDYISTINYGCPDGRPVSQSRYGWRKEGRLAKVR